MNHLLKQTDYAQHPETGLWARADYASIAYSDGDAAENRLLEILQGADDLSLFSPELRACCTDWVTTYHLSPLRANVLRVVEPFLHNAQILEIGSGCGAITRYLGEAGGATLALEGSLRRARIVRERTRDLDNVTVLAESFAELALEHRFDIITLVGVLEYAQCFMPDPDPVGALLKRVRTLLKPSGLLVVAIENQLGAKYLAGAPEDHVGTPFVGVEDRYTSSGPRTFGRRILTQQLQAAGLVQVECLAALPDYKLPVSFVTEAGAQDPDFDAAALARQSTHRDPQRPPAPLWSLEQAWPTLAENGLLMELAPSFVMLARPERQVCLPANLLGLHYNVDRLAPFRKQLRFTRETTDSETDIWVDCEDLQGEPLVAVDGPAVNFRPDARTRYTPGRPLDLDFMRCMARDGWSIQDLTQQCEHYLNVVLELATRQGLSPRVRDGDTLLPGAFLDYIPRNIIRGHDGQHVVIDTEWQLDQPIPVRWLLIRALLLQIEGLTRLGRPAPGTPLPTRRQLIQGVLDALGLNGSEQTIIATIRREDPIHAAITGRVPIEDDEALDVWLDQLLQTEDAFAQLDRLRSELADTRHQASLQVDAMRGLRLSIHHRDNLIRDLKATRREQEMALAAHRDQLETQHRELETLRDSRTELQTMVQAQTQAMQCLGADIENLRASVHALRSSLSWRLTAPVRSVAAGMSRMIGLFSALRHGIRASGGMSASLRAALKLAQEQGPKALIETTLQAGRKDYPTWLKQFGSLDDAIRATMRAEIEGFERPPLISVLVPVYNTPPDLLTAAIASVRNQIYPHWELCIADDASPDPQVRRLLQQQATSDTRIKLALRDENGHISAASNSALALAEGEMIVLLDHDDLLSEDALYWVAKARVQNPRVCLIYSDEDKINEHGQHYDPYFKPNLNRELLLAQNMISHLGAYDLALVQSIGGFRIGLEGSQDYDLALRALEHLEADQVLHIPRVLYHWRAISGSTALASSEKDYASEAGRRAVHEHLERCGITAEVSPARGAPMFNRVRYALPQPLPLVTLIIPTRDRADLLGFCLDRLFERTRYPHYEVLILDNGSSEPGTQDLFDRLPKDRVRIIRHEAPFNFSELNNIGARAARGDVLCLMNNDIEIRTEDWMEEMLSFAMQPEIGCVGARLWYPDGSLQHAGVVLGVGGVANHAHKHNPPGHPGYFGRATLHQNFSVVTAACLMVRREVFMEVDGLDETLAVAFNDVDFCLRVRAQGYRNVWTPYAEMVHHESASRGHEDTPEKLARFHREVALMEERWGDQLRDDPAYSPNLTLHTVDFSLAWPPREWRMEGLSPPAESMMPARRQLDEFAENRIADPAERAISDAGQEALSPEESAAAEVPLAEEDALENPLLKHRRQTALQGLRRGGLGLEIGPSHNPIAPKREGFQVHVVDHLSAEELRQKYRNHASMGVNVDLIETVDFVWQGEPLSELVGNPGAYDWIIASHVIEHVPDIITFLQECAALLKPDGRLSLVVPDKRYCFDHFGSLSTTGHVLDAWRDKRIRPSPGAQFDHFANAVKRDGMVAWNETVTGPFSMLHDMEDPRAFWEKACRDESYVDTHCWRFTMESFEMIIQDLQQLGLIELGIVQILPTHLFEFYVQLGRGGAGVILPDRISRLEAIQIGQQDGV